MRKKIFGASRSTASASLVKQEVGPGPIPTTVILAIFHPVFCPTSSLHFSLGGQGFSPDIACKMNWALAPEDSGDLYLIFGTQCERHALCHQSPSKCFRVFHLIVRAAPNTGLVRFRGACGKLGGHECH